MTPPFPTRRSSETDGPHGRHRRQQYQPPLRPTNEQGRQHHANEQITQERHLDVGFVRRGQAKKLIESFLEGNRDGSLEKLRISTARYDQQCQQVPQQHGQQDRPGLSSNKRAISSVGSRDRKSTRLNSSH